MNDLKKRIASLSQAKHALFQQRLQVRGLAAQSRVISRRASQDSTPPSFAQQRLWFLDRFEGTSTGYHISKTWRLRGELDREALARAINGIVARHESLRTHFVEGDTEPVQVVAPELVVAVLVEDLSALGAELRDQAIAASSRLESATPFELGQGPLVRAKLLVLGEREHVLLWTCHHIVSDGWSQGILARELAAFYAAFREGRTLSLPELPVQYADYAVWQRGWLRGKELERQLSYWRKQLVDAPTLELPGDRPRPPRQTYAGAQHAVVLSVELTARFKAFNRAENVTPFMSLLAAFQVLLARYSGQRDILVGTPIANRQRVELENLIGFFVNTLVLRTDLSGRPGYREVVARVRRAALDAYQHQDLPFEKLVEELNPARDPGRHPIFQAMFALQNAPEFPLELAGLEVSPQRLPSYSTRFDLELHLRAEGDAWAGVFSYNTDLFDGGTVARMAGHFQTLLEAMLAEPERPFSAVDMLTAGERRQILEEWNDTAADYPRDKCVHELFEEQVEKTPEAVAVVFEGEQLTYRELNERADRLASHLRGLGVGADVLVGLCVERSMEMVVGLLGILKAGGAYVPLDPSHPTDRLTSCVDESRMTLLLTRRSIAERFVFPIPIAYIDETSCGLAISSSLDLGVAPMTRVSRAYVIYTSGSTGQPKGVEITHRNLLMSNHARQAFYQETPTVFLLLSSVAVDSSVAGIYWTLTTGGTLVLPTDGTLHDMDLLLALIEDRQVTHLLCLPSLHAIFLEEGPGRVPASLRTVILAGELCRARLVESHRCHLPRVSLFNEYGPTEATVWSTVFDCRLQRTNQAVPIGRPIPNSKAYILDQWLQPVPVGIAGELYVGGEGVARGYLNRPELTAERFIVNPFSDQAGARLYKTGDLCRYLADGNIEFLGRMDQQVKIRGFRVELGEIESTLGLHPGVRQAVVAAREDGAGDKRLAAYVLAADPTRVPEVAELRDFLKQRLPDYMVPAVFVMLEHLPLTPNGKVDRKALPAPEPARELGWVGYVAPRTPTEEALAGIWAEVLKIEAVGVRDNFFALGGHSLLATRMVARIRRVLEVEVPLRTLFEFPTVAGLAGEFPTLAGAAGFQVSSLRPAARDQPLPPSFAQQRLWFLDRFEGTSTGYHISKTWRLRGELDREALARAINGIVARHESLRTHFVEGDTEPVQVVAPELVVAVLVEDLSALGAELRDQAIAASSRLESATPFELGQGPLVRAKLLVLGEREHVLLWTCHHIVSDGWSQGILARELAAFYAAFREGRTLSLPELPVQYADYAVWQRGWLRGKELERQLSYWRKQLVDAPTLELPGDRPRPPRQTYAGAQHAVVLSVELTARLKAFNRAENVTPFMSLLAAFQVLLARYSGQRDILVGTPIANRQRVELENLIGFFVNTLVLRTDLSGRPGYREVVARVRRAALDAYQHQDLPFEKLVEELNPARDPGRHPIFQAMFALQNAPEFPLELAGLEVSPQRLPSYSTRFDLELHLRAEEDAWAGVFSYNTDLFDGGTVARMAGHFQTLLEAMLAEPERPFSAVDMLTAGERRQILEEWNDTAADYPRDKCVHELFEEQVEKTPEAVAVVFEGEQLTYRELNERADRLASHLRGLGVGADVLVGLCVERSMEMVVGLLGILKAGGAYVPLDPSYPKERLAYVVEDTAMRVLVTQNRLIPILPSHQAVVVALDAGFPVSGIAPSAGGHSPENLAYVIYTSGSTGRPKGVAIEHRNVVALIHWAHETFTVEELSGVLASTSICFDLSAFELFVPLTRGGRVILAQNILQLPTLASAGTVTLVNTVPSGMAELLRFGKIPSSVVTINLAGEPLKTSLVRDIYRQSRVKCVYDLYGPSEDTTYSTFCLRRAEGVETIGRPLTNKQVYILNEDRQPLPVGAVGELYVGGSGVARGYLNRPELTAERFIANPFSDQAGARLYKTGDLCRYLPDGNIVFLGRMDHQVKIRGFRVELGEIEATLELHQEVRQAVVVAREDGAGDKRLVAYVVAADPTSVPRVAELRDFLKLKLPDYMVPAVFVMLEHLPSTPNGKVDRKALPVPEPARDPGWVGYVAPRTPTEEALSGIWAEVLGMARVGVYDNFFDLGGHSLMAVRVRNRVEKKLGAKLSLAAFFQNSTIAGLAELLGGASAPDQTIRVLTAQSVGDKPPLFCLHFLSSARRLGKHLGRDRKVYGIESPFDEEIRQWHENRLVSISIEELGTRYLEIIQRQQPRGPYHLAGFCFGGVLAFEVASQLERQGERIATLALLDAFYAPGCKPLAWGWMKRWMYHAGQFSKLGPSYLSKKLGKRIKLAKQRRSKWMSMRRVHPAREHSETERLRLPQADFLGQLLRPYKGRPYAGNAVLFRTLAEPNSFDREISPTNGWEKIILGELQREEIECNHTDLSEEPHVIEVASRLRHHLSRSEAISDSMEKIFSNHPVS